jgi:hypothetical protein
MSTPTPRPWHEAFPAPRCTAPRAIDRHDLLERLRSGARPGTEFLLVDLRRDDFAVCSSCEPILTHLPVTGEHEVGWKFCVFVETENVHPLVGRHNQRIPQFTGPKPLPKSTDDFGAVSGRGGCGGYLVLW